MHSIVISLLFSLKQCAPGYRKSTGGWYLGLCQREDEIQPEQPEPPQLVNIVIDVPNNYISLRPGDNHVVYVQVIGVSVSHLIVLFIFNSLFWNDFNQMR